MPKSVFGSRVARLFSGQTPQRRAVKRLSCPEALEVRYLLSAVMAAEENPQGTVLATLDNGQLTISDIAPNGNDDVFIVNVSGNNLIVNDRTGQFISAPAGGSLSADGKTLSIGFSSAISGLTINGGLGDDFFRVDRLDADFNFNFTIDGGTGTDWFSVATVGVNLSAGSVAVTAETIAVNAPVTAAGAVNLTSTGDDTPMIIAAPVTAGGDSRFVSDQMRISAPIDLGSHVLTLAPESTADSNDSINIGADGDAEVNTLLISNTELDLIKAGTIVIGDENTGTITVGAAIEVAGDSDIQVVTGRDIIFMDGSSWTTTDGDLSFVANQAGTAVGTGHLNGIDLEQTTITSLGAGDITLNGHGGNGDDYNVGIFGRFGSRIQSLGTGQIDLTGTGGTGTTDNRGIQLNEVSITSVAGNVHLTGQGGDSSGNWNIGVWLSLGASISTSANASITINGTAGDGTTDNNGVQFNGFGYGGATQLTSENGDIWIVGHGANLATDGWNRGIGVYEGTVIRSTGTSNITLEGFGGSGTHDSRGIEVGDAGTTIASVTGNIQLTGHGAASSSAYGVWVRNGALIESTGTAHITLNGTGGDAYDGNGVILNGSGTTTTIRSRDGDITIIGQGGNAADGSIQRGVGIFDGSQVISTGVARITLNGTGGAGTDAARGVQIGGDGTLISSVAGRIQVTGQGGNNTSGYGVWMESGAMVESTGTAEIAIDGTGGDAHDGNGVLFTGNGSATRVSSLDGDITITGHGGDSAEGSVTRGIAVFGGSVIESTGAAKIILNGTGGASVGNSRGVEIEDDGTRISSLSGDIHITGQGGAGAGDMNIGVWIVRGAVISASGSARVMIDGTGGSGVNENNGVMFNGYGNGDPTNLTAQDGDITIIGHGSTTATGSASRGIGIYTNSTIQSTGTGKITLDGTAGAGSDSARGVEMAYAGALITSRIGDISVTGQGGDNNSGYGVWMVFGGAIESTGTAKITIEGTAGDAVDANGVVMTGGGVATHVTSVDGDITILGHGGNFSATAANRGLALTDGAVVQSTGQAKIILNGTSGIASDSSRGIEIVDIGTRITSATGDIQITGQGGDNAYGFGIWIRTGAVVESTDTAKITMNGTGGAGDGEDAGVVLNGYGNGGPTRIASVNGDISITGHGGNSVIHNADRGIGMYEGSSIVSTGAAKIVVDGTAGSGLDAERGVEIGDANTKISSQHGDISITGHGGIGSNPSSTYNVGIWIRDGAVVESTATDGVAAKITIDGTGGAGSDANIGVWITSSALVTSKLGDIQLTGHAGAGLGLYNYGVNLQSGGKAVSTGSAKITVDGTGADGFAQAHGVFLQSSSAIQSLDGDIQIIGHAGSGGDFNLGVGVQSGGSIESLGIAKITVDGTGGQGTSSNIGVRVSGADSVIRSAVGDVQITGHGGSGTGIFQHGVMLENGGAIVSTGTAKITVDGTAGSGAGRSVGAYVAGTNSTIQSQDGNIQITGVGGTIGDSNTGVSIQEGGSIESFGAAKIIVSGNGGLGTTDANHGVRIYGTDTFIRSATGDIQVVGIGGSGTTFNSGVDVQVGGSIISTGTARINVTGIGGTGVTDPGSGVGQVGVWLLNSNSSIIAHDGAVQINGIGGGDVGTSGNHGVFFQSGIIATTAGGAANVQVVGTAGIGSTSFGININSDSATVGIDTSEGTGNISLVADGLNISSDFNPGAVNSGVHTVTIQPKTTSTAINLGGADSNGVLGLTDAELDRITAARLNVGNSFGGTITVSADITRPAATDMQLVTGGDVAVSGGMLDTDGGLLSLTSGVAPRGINPSHAGVDAIASTVTLGSDLLIAINGLVPDSDYTQLNVIGGIDLNGVNLVLSGSKTPAPDDSFTIVNNDGTDPIIGTFQGLAEGSLVQFHGKNMRISYVGGSDGNDVVLTAVNLPPIAENSNLSVTQNLPTSGPLTATDSDSVSLVYGVVTNPTHGTVVITNSATGAYTYTPNTGYFGPDSFTFKASDGSLDSNVATVSITVHEVNVAPQLNLNGGPVTFSAKAARKGGPVVVVPNVTVVDPNVSAGLGIGGGTLTVSIDASAKVSKKAAKLHDTIGGLSTASSLGTTSGAAFQNGKLVLTVVLNDSTTTADVQSFLRGITFKTKGPGLKQAQRILLAQLTDAAGAQSNVLQQTVIVTK